MTVVDIDEALRLIRETNEILAGGNSQPDVEPSHSWTPIDIVARAGEPPEPPVIGGIVYPGRRHLFSGEPEALKSWAAMVLCVEQIRAGNTAVYLDFEMGGRETLARLRDMHVTDEELNERFVYIEPSESFMDSVIRSDTDLLLRERMPTLVIVDAFTGALQVHNLDPNKSIDIETFYRNVVDPLRAYNAAVVVLDHLPKDVTTRGRFAIGSERKVGAAEVHLGFEIIAPFGRGRTGKAKIITHKDRPGHLRRPRAGELELTSAKADGAVSWTLTHPEHVEEITGTFRPTRLMEKVSVYLELQHEPASMTQIETSVIGKVEFVRKAVENLVLEGLAGEEPGPRNARLFTSLNPYREATDTTPSHPVPTPSRTGSRVNPSPSPPLQEGDGVTRAEDDVAETGPPRPDAPPLYTDDDEPYDWTTA